MSRGLRYSVCDDDVDCFAVSMDTAQRYIEIDTHSPPPGHGGGLVKTFDAADRLCLRQLKYRFRFTDSNPEASHEDPDDHGFAYFVMGEGTGMNGFLVSSTGTSYELLWFGCDEDDEEEDDNAIMSVAPGRWYDVTVTFDWTIDGSEQNWAFVTCEGDDGTIERKKRVLSNRQPLTAMRLYNYSPGVAHCATCRALVGCGVAPRRDIGRGHRPVVVVDAVLHELVRVQVRVGGEP